MKKHLLTFLTLAVALCFGTFQANAQGANYVSCDCPAGVSAGLPMGPADPMFILGSSVADDIAATAIPTSAETNTTDYALVVANSTDSLVLGLANANGGYDFSESPEGSYWFVGFAYNQSELVTIATTLDALPAAFLAAQLGLPVATVEAIQAAIDPATVDLADFFVLLDQLSTSPLSINSLVGSLNGIACAGTAGSVIAACFATSDVPAYSIEVVAAPISWDDCDGATPIDLVAGSVSGPYDNTTLTPGGEGTPACFAESAVDNSGWVSFVGDGGSYFIYSSPECAGGVNLVNEDTYMPFGDTQIAVYTGNCGDLLEVACNEDAFYYGAAETAEYGYFAGVTVNTEVGVTYYAMIDGYDGEVGQFCLQVIEAGCPNIDLAEGTPGDVTLCESDTYTVSVNDATLDLGIDLLNTPIALWVVSTEPLDEGIMTEVNAGIIVELLPADAFTLAGNADGLYVNTQGTATTVSEVWVTGLVVSELLFNSTGDLVGLANESSCELEYSAAVHVTFYAAGSPECSTVVEPPANDDCANALTLDISNGAINGPYTNVAATGEGTTPPDCFGDDDTSVDPPVNYYDNSVWFMFTGTGEAVTLSTSIDGVEGALPNGDTQMAVFTGSCDGGLTEIACSEDIDSTNYLSSLSLATEAGMMYYVVVDGYYYSGGPDAGNFNILVSTESVVDPLNVVATVTVSPFDGNYIVSFDVTGGVGLYTYSGVVNGDSDLYGTSFDSDFISCGEGYTLTVTDAEGTVVTVSEVAVSCGADPLAVAASTSYDAVNNSYVVAFTVTGGTPAYNVTGSAGVITAGDGTFLSEGIPCGTGYSFVITDVAGQTLTLSGDAPAECATVEPLEANVDILYDSVADEYVLTINAVGGVAPYSIDGVSGGNTWTFILPCGDNYSYTITDATGASVVLSDSLPECIGLPAIDVTYVINCDNTVGEYTVTFNVSGGLPSIDGGATGYTYSGLIAGSSADLGTSFTSSPNGDGSGFTLVVTDEGGNTTTVSEATVACVKCNYSAGDMSDDLIVACGGESISTSAVGVVDSSGVFVYVLHTAAGTTAGTQIAVDANTADGANFSFGANMEYGVTYYVSSVVGNDDGTGVPDLSHECTEVAAGTPVIFTSPIVVDWDVVCDPETKRGEVTLHVTGGTAPYEISGNLFSGTYTPNMLASDVNTGHYTATAVDANGCTGSFTDSIDCKKPLAVTWRSFSGEVKENGNALTWATAMEINNDYFMVQRSLDGVNFETIATVKGMGNSNVATEYSYLDQNAPESIAYYQITQVDYDGAKSSTDVITLQRNAANFGIVSINPVPAVSNINVVFNANATGDVMVTIYDAAGRNVMNSTNHAIAGVNTLNFDIANLAAGTYFVKINDGYTVSVSKFVK
jgi:hypothetical protein